MRWVTPSSILKKSDLLTNLLRGRVKVVPMQTRNMILLVGLLLIASLFIVDSIQTTPRAVRSISSPTVGQAVAQLEDERSTLEAFSTPVTPSVQQVGTTFTAAAAQPLDQKSPVA